MAQIDEALHHVKARIAVFDAGRAVIKQREEIARILRVGLTTEFAQAQLARAELALELLEARLRLHAADLNKLSLRSEQDGAIPD